MRVLKDDFGDGTEQVLHHVLRLLNHVIQDNSDLQENACLIGLVSLSKKLSVWTAFLSMKIAVLMFMCKSSTDVYCCSPAIFYLLIGPFLQVPVVTNFASTERSREIRTEVANFVRQLCQTRLTFILRYQTFVSISHLGPVTCK